MRVQERGFTFLSRVMKFDFDGIGNDFDVMILMGCWMFSKSKKWFGRQFHVFERFMLVSSDKFGSSWGLKGDLNDEFMFLSCCIEALEW